MKLTHILLLLVLLVALAIGAFLAFRQGAPDWEEIPPEDMPADPVPENNSNAAPDSAAPDTDNEASPNAPGNSAENSTDPAPPMTEPLPRVLFETSMGDVVFELWEDRMPWSVANFVNLTERGAYDGVWFHRIIDQFMIQGGDLITRGADDLPPAAGTGDPGYSWRDESNGDRQFDRKGLLAMANAGPNTNGSQFFITLAPTPHLNTPDGAEPGTWSARPHHNIFGEVIEGMHVVEAIGATDTGHADRPNERIVVERATVLSKRSHPYRLPTEAVVRGTAPGEPLPRVRFETSMGDVVFELWEDRMPWSVANFVNLTERGIYDDVWFHRIIDGFMIQGGDPNSAGHETLPEGIGEGDAGVTWRDENNGDRKFDRKGLLAMANAGKDTNGSQFFITLAPTPWLNSDGERGYHHNIFGEVIEGMDVVEAIGKAAVDEEVGHRPLEKICIVRAIVEWKRDHEYRLPPEAIVPDNGDGDGDGGGGEGEGDGEDGGDSEGGE